MHDGIPESFGTPGEDVTHWGISRKLSERRGPSGRAINVVERCTHPDATGLRMQEWDISELSLEEIKKRWDAGTFQIHWIINEPGHADPKKRRRSGGNGPFFTVDPEQEEAAPVALPTLPATLPAVAAPATGVGLGDLVGLLTTVFGLSRQMSAQAAPVVAPRDELFAEMSGRLANMEAKLDAEKREREVEERHRNALAEKDREIERERRRREEAEREAEDDRDRPPFEPGVPITEQLPAIIANTVAQIATKSPETAQKLIEWGYEKFMSKPAAVAPSVPRETPPVAQPPQPPRPVTRIVRPPVAPPPPPPAPSAPPPAQDNDQPIPSVSSNLA